MESQPPPCGPDLGQRILLVIGTTQRSLHKDPRKFKYVGQLERSLMDGLMHQNSLRKPASS